MKINFYIRVIYKYILYHLNKNSPISANIRITDKCNLNCYFCKIKNNNNEINSKEIINVIKQLDKMKVAYLTVTGGEPLLRKDLEIILKNIKKSNMFVSLNTNGTLINEKNAYIIANSFNQIRISIDGNEKTHDNIRGEKGSYKKTISAIKLLNKVKKKKAKIFVHYVVLKENIHEIFDFYYKFNKIADSISFMPVSNIDKMTLKKFLIIFNEIEKFNKLNQIKEFMKPSLYTGKKFCDAGKLYFQILPNGNLKICPNIDDSKIIGNIKHEKIKEILKKKKLIKKQKKTCIGCYSRCTTEISMLIRKSPFQLIKIIPSIIKRYKI